MTTFAVIRKADQAETYRYVADAPVEWLGMEFATHDHVVVPDVAVLPTPAPILEWDRLAFLRRFTAQERMTIRAARATDPILNDVFSLLEQAITVHSNDPDTLAGMGYLVLRGWITAARRDEIMGVV